MDMVLLGITVLSLVVAAAMAVLARRAWRAEHLRSTARIAALRAAADAEPEAAPVAVAESVAVGEPRVPAAWPPIRPSRVSAVRTVSTPEPPSSTALTETFLGASAVASGSGGRQRGLAIAAAVLFVVAIAGGYWAVFVDRTPAAAAGAPTASGQALELVSLRHERRGAKLDVVGLVRNPVAGGTIDKLTAVVFLFDRQGGFLSSARASVDYLRLVPGDESPFVISMDAPASVARYRVSFRNDGGVVPHIDRRGQEPVAAHALTPATATQ